jgi:hypothetical protein
VTRFTAHPVEDQIASCLLLTNRVALGWSVLGPRLRSEGSLESMTGVFSKKEGLGRKHSKPGRGEVQPRGKTLTV